MSPKLRTAWAKWLVRTYLWRTLPLLHRNAPVESKIRRRTASLLYDGYRSSRPAALSGFLAPAELLHLYGVSPMFTEYLAPMLADADLAPQCLEATEALGHSREACTFHRATLGAGLLGYLPAYDLVAATSHPCDGLNKTLELLAAETGADYFLLDVPQGESPEAEAYLAGQLEELEALLMKHSGRPRASVQQWERVFAASNETRRLMRRFNELKSHPASPVHGKQAFTLNLCAWLMMGTSQLRDDFVRLVGSLEPLQNAPEPANPPHRLLWLLAFPFYPGEFAWDMEESFKLRVVADELSSVFWPELDPKQPYRSLARKMLANPLLGPVDRRLENIEGLARQAGVDGVIHFSHWGCRQGCGGVQPIAERLRQLNLPFLELHGDCIDGRQAGQGQSRTRLQGFAELLAKRSRAVPGSQGRGSQIFAGLDIGSLTAKAVLINGHGELLQEDVLFTGASSRKTASRLHALLYEGEHGPRIARCVATGYGRKGVGFADEEITEISCHARGMAHQVPEVRTIIDIGGQDTKVIALDGEGGVRSFLMNDKCAAGTGRFLEMMARALEIDLEDLGPQALKASRAADISSLCTVFAESEVVSLIAEDTPTPLICRGICRSVARRTLAMLERVGREPPIAMSGGVAFNVGVVRELEKALSRKLSLPERPQTLGALGAALFARDKHQ